MKPKPFLIPPLVQVFLMLLWLGLFLVSDPTMNDGSPDVGGMQAAGALLFVWPIFFIPFGILNLVDSAFDRFENPWLGSFGIYVILCMLLSAELYAPEVDSSPAFGIGMSIVVSAMVLFPMTLLRRLVLKPKKAVVALHPDRRVPISVLFPTAGAAPKIPTGNPRKKPTGSEH